MREHNGPSIRIRVGNDAAAIDAARGIIGALNPHAEISVQRDRTQATVSAPARRNIGNPRRS